MHHPRFFGFGSLVNCATHTYPNTKPAILTGWRRIWMPTGDRDIVALSVHQNPASAIEGLSADVPNANWAALDARERGYNRHIVTSDIADESRETWVYAVPDRNLPRDNGRVILQSYLDVVLQGFLRQSGEPGVRAFFETTDGWDIPVLNDRDTPQYVRHQPLNASERSLFDHLRATLT